MIIMVVLEMVTACCGIHLPLLRSHFPPPAEVLRSRVLSCIRWVIRSISVCAWLIRWYDANNIKSNHSLMKQKG